MRIAPIITAGTAAGTAQVEVEHGKRVLITCDDLGSETITIQVDAGSYVDLYKEGTQQALTATHNALYLTGPGRYQVTKPTTSASVGVYAVI